MVIARAPPSSFLLTASMLKHHDKLAPLACHQPLLQHISILKAMCTQSICRSAEVYEAELLYQAVL